jgi:ArsR family transcriptional regulator, arsenate/arsenite/antimonite-responsive transcriptional repressor
LMGDKEICVCYFVRVLRQSQPKISRHLAYLRRAGIVTARRQGTWMHYRIASLANRDAAGVLRQMLAWWKHDPQMCKDLARLRKVCCSPKRLATLRGAPLPVAVTCRCGPAKR